MSAIVFTPKYLASAPHADLEVTYPDGRTRRSRMLSDGNGMLVAMIRCAIRFERGSALRDLSQHLDRVLRSHEDALKSNPNIASSQWAHLTNPSR